MGCYQVSFDFLWIHPGWTWISKKYVIFPSNLKSWRVFCKKIGSFQKNSQNERLKRFERRVKSNFHACRWKIPQIHHLLARVSTNFVAAQQQRFFFPSSMFVHTLFPFFPSAAYHRANISLSNSTESKRSGKNVFLAFSSYFWYLYNTQNCSHFLYLPALIVCSGPFYTICWARCVCVRSFTGIF